MDVVSTSAVTSLRPGKSGQAVGQIAKVAVAEAKAAGAELPKNAQGMAASAIAQGADPGAVFAALVSPEPILETEDFGDEPAATGGDGIASSDAIDAADGSNADGSNIVVNATGYAEEGYKTASEVFGDSIQGSAETALALLQEVG